MQMGDKDGREFRKTDMRAAQLHLGALPTIHHKLLPTYLNHLGRRVMTECGQGAPTS